MLVEYEDLGTGQWHPLYTFFTPRSELSIVDKLP